MMYHEPVLLQECIDGLDIDPEGVYVDVTFGGGGHSKEILKKLTTGRLIAFDRDKDAKSNLPDDERLLLIQQDFRYMKNFLKYNNATPVDGILADLGVSSHQFDVAERGFSSRFDAELDMRMDQEMEITAADIINDYPEHELARVFFEYGEVREARKIARAIVAERLKGRISTIGQLKGVITPFARRGKENQYYAKIFQALRIELNDELGALKELLVQSKDVLNEGGRLVVLSYHSLEDRLVKNYMRSGKFKGEPEKDEYGKPLVPFNPLTRKPIVASAEEVERNTRARSAKLRIAERTDVDTK